MNHPCEERCCNQIVHYADNEKSGACYCDGQHDNDQNETNPIVGPMLSKPLKLKRFFVPIKSKQRPDSQQVQTRKSDHRKRKAI